MVPVLDGLRVLDAHVHLAPERLAVAVRDALTRMYGWQLAGPLDPAAVLAEVRAAGADRCVHLPYAHRAGIAAGLNEHSASLATAWADVVAFATVHPDDPDPVGMLAGAVEAGCRGLKVHCPVQRTRADDPRMQSVYAWCADHGIPVLMHAGHGPDAHTEHGGVEPFRALLRRHPTLRICVAHLGAPEADAFLDLLPAHPSLWLDVSSVLHDLDAAGTTAARVGAAADRLVYGSDHPNVPLRPAEAMTHLGALGLARDRLAAVLWDNGHAFLGTPV